MQVIIDQLIKLFTELPFLHLSTFFCRLGCTGIFSLTFSFVYCTNENFNTAYYILHAITDLLGPIGPSCLGRSSYRCRADLRPCSLEAS